MRQNDVTAIGKEKKILKAENKRKEYRNMELQYKKVGDYYFPDIELSEQSHYPVGKYGRLRLEFLKEHRKGTYDTLLMNGKLNEHLHQTETEAKNQVRQMVDKMAKERGIDEELKSLDQLRWVAEMNNCKSCAEEIVMREIIFA